MSEPNVNTIPTTQSKTNVKTITSMAMLTAIAYVVMVLSKVTKQQRSASKTRGLAAFIFFHPDYTVGPGVPPGQRIPSGIRSRTLPPVGNHAPP